MLDEFGVALFAWAGFSIAFIPWAVMTFHHYTGLPTWAGVIFIVLPYALGSQKVGFWLIDRQHKN